MPFAVGMPGYQEWLVILIVGLLIFGRRLPEVGRTLGKTVVQLRKGIADFKTQLRQDEDFRDVKATVHDFKRAMDAPRTLADPTRLLDDLTDEALATPGPPAAASEPAPKVENDAVEPKTASDENGPMKGSVESGGGPVPRSG